MNSNNDNNGNKVNSLDALVEDVPKNSLSLLRKTLCLGLGFASQIDVVGRYLEKKLENPDSGKKVYVASFCDYCKNVVGKNSLEGKNYYETGEGAGAVAHILLFPFPLIASSIISGLLHYDNLTPEKKEKVKHRLAEQFNTYIDF